MSYYDREKSPNNGGNTLAVGGNLGWPQPHLGHAPEYQVSGFPFAYTIINDSNPDPQVETAYADNTVFEVSFPFVTRWVIVSAHKGNDRVIPDKCHIAFNENGFDTGNYVDSRFSGDIRLEMKLSKIYIRFTDSSAIDHVEVLAGLTNISSGSMDSYHTTQNLAGGGTNIPGLNVTPDITITVP